ncbi:MAG: hypothetical protein K2X32_00850, partial [Phycisphaerales bacterium]|nr:hypothetical protein [Phycisphaerales bacterium]
MIKTPSTEPFTPDKLPDGAFRTILDELLRSERTIAEIAGEFKLSFVQLQSLLESPEAQAEFAALKVVAAIRHDATAPIRRENALARLTHIAAFNLD